MEKIGTLSASVKKKYEFLTNYLYSPKFTSINYIFPKFIREILQCNGWNVSFRILDGQDKLFLCD
jgi:hypothetical protein